MSTAIVTGTRRGLLAWIGRQFELMNITATLKAGVRERELLAHEVATGPRRLARLEADLQELRVRRALLTPRTGRKAR